MASHPISPSDLTGEICLSSSRFNRMQMRFIWDFDEGLSERLQFGGADRVLDELAIRFAPKARTSRKAGERMASFQAHAG